MTLISSGRTSLAFGKHPSALRHDIFADRTCSDYVTKNIDYLKTQVGNPEGANKPNKKKYDPRVWVREGEKTMKTRVEECLHDFNAAGSL